MSIPVPYASPATPTLRERINLRVVVFIGVFALIFGAIGWTWLDATLSGGIKDRGSYTEVDLKTISTFAFNQNTGTIDSVPPEYRALDGKTVLLVGEEAPGATEIDGVPRRFDLVYSVANCCFNGPPQIQHFVHVTVPENAVVNITKGGSWKVSGKFKVDVTRDPETNKVTGIYHVLASKVESVDA